MGSFHADAIKVRVLPEVTIVFWKPRAIVVIPTTPPARLPVLFNIPFLRRNDYVRYWADFRRALWRQKHLTLEKCQRLATRNGVIEMSTVPRLQFGEKPIEIICRGWQAKAKGGRIHEL